MRSRLHSVKAACVGDSHSDTVPLCLAAPESVLRVHARCASLHPIFRATQDPGITIADCGFWSISGSDGKSYNATATLTGDNRGLVLTASAAAGVTPVGSSGLWGVWPVVTLYNNEGFPAIPWKANL